MAPSECQVEGLIEAERHAFGVGPIRLLLAEGDTHLVETVIAIVRFGVLPLFSRSLKEGLCYTVELGGSLRVAEVRGDTCQRVACRALSACSR